MVRGAIAQVVRQDELTLPVGRGFASGSFGFGDEKRCYFPGFAHSAPLGRGDIFRAKAST